MAAAEAVPVKDAAPPAAVSATDEDVLQLLQEGEWDSAAELASQVLEARCAQYGESAVECARSYALYGAALLEKARCDSDVFGAKVQDAAKAKTEALIQEAMAEGEAAGAEADDAESEDAESDEEGDEEADDAEQPAADETAEGKDPVAAATEAVAPAADVAGSSADVAGSSADAEAAAEADEGDEDGASAEDDMQLAWEMLEVARTLYSKAAPVDASALADVHLHLADVAMEQACFDIAADDYAKALACLAQCDQAGSRRAAELHFKASHAHQHMDAHKGALDQAQKAIAILEALLASLKPAALQSAAAAEPAQMFGVPDAPAAEAAAATATKAETTEAAELQSVLDELWERVDELKEAGAKSDAEFSRLSHIKDEIKDAMGALGEAMQPEEQGIAFGSKPAPVKAEADAKENIPAASNGSAVHDLGTAGRGRKRITPAATAPTDAAGTDGAQAKRAKLENGDFKPAGESVQNTVQPDAPQQTVTEALASVEAA